MGTDSVLIQTFMHVMFGAKHRGAPPLIRVLTILCLLATYWVVPCQASPVLEMLGTDTPDHPWSGRSASEGPSTAYFNPARLSKNRRITRFSYLVTARQLQLDYGTRPAGYDVPESVYSGRQWVDGNLRPLDGRPFATADLPHARPNSQRDDTVEHFLVFGLSMPLIENRLSLGILTTLKAGFLQTQRPFFPDERQQYFGDGLTFEFMGDRLESMMATIGIALQITDTLAVGVGGTLLNNASSVPQIYIPDASDQEQAQTTPVIEVEPTIAPHFGVVWSVLETVEVSSALHLPSESRLTGQGQLRFWEFEYPDGQDRLNQPFELVFMSQPLRASLGVKIEHRVSENSDLEVYGDTQWTQWSRYVARHGETPSDWSDTVAGAVGLRWSMGPQRLGWAVHYSPTPVPEQNGRTNYVDNTRLATQLGWSWTMLRDGYALNLGVGVQCQRWLSRTHFKTHDAIDAIVDEFPESVDARTLEPIPESRGVQTNNLGFPYYSHGGWLNTVIFSVALVQ